MDLEFGDHAKDIVTDFEGICLGSTIYGTGCEQILLVPKIDKDGAKRDGEWFDIDRIEVIEKGVVKFATSITSRTSVTNVANVAPLARTGGDRPAPTK